MTWDLFFIGPQWVIFVDHESSINLEKPGIV